MTSSETVIGRLYPAELLVGKGAPGGHRRGTRRGAARRGGRAPPDATGGGARPLQPHGQGVGGGGGGGSWIRRAMWVTGQPGANARRRVWELSATPPPGRARAPSAR